MITLIRKDTVSSKLGTIYNILENGDKVFIANVWFGDNTLDCNIQFSNYPITMKQLLDVQSVIKDYYNERIELSG